MGDEDDDFSFAPKVLYVKPDNQLELTPKELALIHTRTLSWRDPNRTKGKVKFSYKDWMYKDVATQEGDDLAIHFQMDGSALFTDSEQGKKQIQLEEIKRKVQEKLEQDKKNFLG